MSIGPTSVEQIVNEALDRIGYPERIGNIYEGTKQARIALDIYSQTRDALLREVDWDFSELIAVAVVAATPPPALWLNAYVYPTDCIRIRNLFNGTYLADKNNPTPTNWTVADSPVDGKVIYANLDGAVLIYSAQVSNMTLWEPLFTESLIAGLGRRLAPALASMNEMKAEAQDEKMMTELGASIVG